MGDAVVRTEHFVVRPSRRTRCPGFPCGAVGLYMRGRADAGSAAKAMYDRWGSRVEDMYGRHALSFHGVVAKLLLHAGRKDAATLTTPADVRLTSRGDHVGIRSRFPERSVAAHADGWLLIPVRCAVSTDRGGHIFLAAMHASSGEEDGRRRVRRFFFDPNGPVHKHGSMTRTGRRGAAQEVPLTACERYGDCYVQIAAIAKAEAEGALGGPCDNLLTKSHPQREATAWMRTQGVCMAVVYWMAMLVGLNPSFSPSELRKCLQFREAQWRGGGAEGGEARMRALARAMRILGEDGRPARVAGVPLLADDEDVEERCEAYRRESERHDALVSAIDERRRGDDVRAFNRAVRAHNDQLTALRAARHRATRDVSIEQFLECPDLLSKHVTLAPEHLDPNNLRVSAHRRSRVRRSLLEARIELNFYETQILMFMAFVAELSV